MEYVMVPVPEEIVDEVRAYVSWGLTMNKAPADNPEAMKTAVAAADDHTRALLRLLAHDTLDDRFTTLRESAAAVGVSTREIIGLVSEFNADLAQAGGSPLTIVGKADHRPIEAGVKPSDHKLLVITRSNADVLAEVLSPD